MRTISALLPDSLWGWVSLVLSLLGIIALLVFMFVPATREGVGLDVTDSEVNAFTAGVLVMLGILILIYDPISMMIVRQQNVGWLFVLAGLYFVLARSLGPLLATVKPYQVTYFVIGLVLLVGGYFIVRRH